MNMLYSPDACATDWDSAFISLPLPPQSSRLKPNQLLLGDNLDVMRSMPSQSADGFAFSPPYFRQRSYNGLGIGYEKQLDQWSANLLPRVVEMERILKASGYIIANVAPTRRNDEEIDVAGALIVTAAKAGLKVVERFTVCKTNAPPSRKVTTGVTRLTEDVIVFAKVRSKPRDRYFDPSPFQEDRPAARPYKPSKRLGLSYRGKIDASQLTPIEKMHAHRELTEAIQEAHDGKSFGFRMKLRGIHKLPSGGEASGMRRKIDRFGFCIVRRRTTTRRAVNIVQYGVERGRKTTHPAVAPVGLFEKFVRAFCRPGELVIDPFMGSGTTAMACINSGRSYVGIEIDPEYHAESILNVSLFRDDVRTRRTTASC